MLRVDELVFLHQLRTPCHLAVIAESFGLNTRIVTHAADLVLDNNQHRFLFIGQTGAALDRQGIPLLASRLVTKLPVALYQVERESLDQETALLLGIRGLLYTDQSINSMGTGLRKMLADELWFDRGLISRVFRRLVKEREANEHVSSADLTILKLLTQREKAVIQLVSSGARNKEIADHLCISEHTVKAHISSIFRKTQSRNRVELLKWTLTYHVHLAFDS